jgi:hypothetical protein
VSAATLNALVAERAQLLAAQMFANKGQETLPKTTGAPTAFSPAGVQTEGIPKKACGLCGTKHFGLCEAGRHVENPAPKAKGKAKARAAPAGATDLTWPFGWCEPTPGYISFPISPGNIQKGTLDLIQVYVADHLGGDVSYETEGNTGEYFEMRVLGSHLANFTLAITSRASKSKNARLASMGPRVYIRGIPRGVHNEDKTREFLDHLRMVYGRA